MLRVLPKASRGVFRYFSCTAQSDPSPRKRNIIGITRDEVAQMFEQLELKSTVEKKVFQWIYGRGVQSFDEIPDSEIGKVAKQILAEHLHIDYGSLLHHSSSQDTTQKWLVKCDNKNSVESVYLFSLHQLRTSNINL
jgi:23S rRNA (adenine2503-C2)-methyltransferase